MFINDRSFIYQSNCFLSSRKNGEAFSSSYVKMMEQSFIYGSNMSRPSRKTEIREAVLSATLKLVADGGFHQSPMSKLAEQAKISVGSIYIYFPSKDAIIAELFEEIRKRMQEDALRNYDATVDVKKRFEVLFLNICDCYLRNKEYMIFLDQFAMSSYNRSSLDAFSDEVQAVFLKLYQDGIQSGAIKKLPFDIIAALIHGPIIYLLKKHHMGFTKVGTQALIGLKDCVWESVRL